MNLKRCATCGVLLLAAHASIETLNFCETHNPEPTPVVRLPSLIEDPKHERAGETHPNLSLFVRSPVASLVTPSLPPMGWLGTGSNYDSVMRKSRPWSPAYYDTFNTNTAVIAYAANEEKKRLMADASLS
jgi:hypothetical protein